MKSVRTKPGFALITTLSLMVLLAILAVGMLSLSAVSLRSVSQGSAQAEARANARMALMIAIGELQKHAGPDTRVTAPSGIVDESAAPLTGAWKSWEGTDHESTGRPVIPTYDDKTNAESDGGRFLAWLVSGDATDDPANSAALASGSAGMGTVPLLSEGTLGAAGVGQVHVVPQTLAENSGAYAWWVSGENQKARLPKHYVPANTAADWSDIAKSHAVADPNIFGLEQDLLVVPSPADRAISFATANFVAPNATIPIRDHFHDLSVSSIGLLTNTATGGWRKDMSLMTEYWASLSATNLPFFRISPAPGDTSSVTKPTDATIKAAQSMLYPWSEYPTGSTVLSHGAVTSWHNLMDYSQAYRRYIYRETDGSFKIRGVELPLHNMPTVDISSGTAGHFFNHLHRIKAMPIIARIHWVFSHRTIRNDNGTPLLDSDDTFSVQLLMSPVITMWNPYNVTITTPNEANITLKLARPLPSAFRYYDRDGNPLVDADGKDYKRVFRGMWPDWPSDPNTNGVEEDIPDNHPPMVPADIITHVLRGPLTYAPGETRVFSPLSAVAFTGSTTITMDPGYRPGTGLIVDNRTTGLRAEDPVKVDAKFDAQWVEGRFRSVGMYLDYVRPSGGMVQFYRMQYSPAAARTYWPPMPYTDFAQPQAVSLETQFQPFMSLVWGSRVSGETTNLPPGKGVLQTNPLLSYERVNQGAATGATGNTHPVNSSTDWSVFKHTGNDDKLPNASNDGRNRGYIISGFTAADGLSRMILANLAMRPIASLGELQHWDLRSQNAFAPHQLNVIGNSDAVPLIPSDSAVNPASASSPYNFQHDDSYCANHLLFDDWFVSSIADEPHTFGRSYTSPMFARYKIDRYQNFLMDHKANPLVHRSYHPIAQDQYLTSTQAVERRTAMLGTADGWQRLASRLEVEGMFNVNSTSVKAWRALLGHARNQRVPHLTEGVISMSAQTDHAISRAPVAADVEAGVQGMAGPQIWSSEFSGYRVFDDEMLDTLAEKIVEQVRLRGPFLSLSEFVNRRLGVSTDERALAGAIQVALNQMAEELPDKDPQKTLKTYSRVTVANPLGDHEYQFNKAAEGHSSYGLPGWIRQADVLTPLAPILSARDDTFTIRAYGDARDKDGNVLAKAWCEATVLRTRDFVDPADPADNIDTPTSDANVRFGRRFAIHSFRWLSPVEV